MGKERRCEAKTREKQEKQNLSHVLNGSFEKLMVSTVSLL